MLRNMITCTLELENMRLEVEIDEHETGRALADRLPLETEMSRWGDELYGDCGISGSINLDSEMGRAREIMEIGELAYWPDGDALCVFFGHTPASTDERPRAISPVIPLGRVRGDATVLRSLPPSSNAVMCRA